MSLRINDTAPRFYRRHYCRADQFSMTGSAMVMPVLFSHPKDFTPVCTTELGYMAGLTGDFAARNCKILGISVDPVENHHKWKADVEAVSGNKVDYPMIGDPEAGGGQALRHAAGQRRRHLGGPHPGGQRHRALQSS